MKFVKIPDIKNTWDNVVIKTLSPSSFSWIDTGCSYQLLLQKALDSFNDRRYLLPTSKSILIGTIIHKIYELSSKKEICSIPVLLTGTGSVRTNRGLRLKAVTDRAM